MRLWQGVKRNLEEPLRWLLRPEVRSWRLEAADLEMVDGYFLSTGLRYNRAQVLQARTRLCS
jgi:hypothetical protein